MGRYSGLELVKGRQNVLLWKKNQKTFIEKGRFVEAPRKINESFLLLFSKKKTFLACREVG
jgi:hypothetical protein